MSILHGLQDIKWPALEISIYLAIVHLSPVTLRFRQVSGVLFSAWIRNELCLRSTVSVGVYVFTTLQSSFFVIVLPRMVPATCFFAWLRALMCVEITQPNKATQDAGATWKKGIFGTSQV
jgi:hypothetical protein